MKTLKEISKLYKNMNHLYTEMQSRLEAVTLYQDTNPADTEGIAIKYDDWRRAYHKLRNTASKNNFPKSVNGEIFLDEIKFTKFVLNHVLVGGEQECSST